MRRSARWRFVMVLVAAVMTQSRRDSEGAVWKPLELEQAEAISDKVGLESQWNGCWLVGGKFRCSKSCGSTIAPSC